MSTVQYTGATTQATIDDTNADVLTEGAYAGGETSLAMDVGVVSESRVNNRPRYLNLARTVENAIMQIDVTAPPGIVESGAITRESDSFNGDCGGSCSYVIDVDDATWAFTGSLTFNSYCSDGVTLSGSASFSGTYDDVNDEFEEFSLSITSLTASADSDSFTISGNISYDFQVIPPTATADLRLRCNSTGEVFWARDYTITVVEGPNYADMNVTGRFYHPTHGYVDVSTPTAFRFFDGDESPSQGVMVLDGTTGIGGGSTKARLTAHTLTTYEVEADTNGDGTYDWSSGILSS